MSKRQCLTKMESLVKRYVKSKTYQNDFYVYDIDTITNSSPEQKSFVWIVRDCGTWLCKEERVAKYTPYTYCYNDKSARYYHIDTDKGEVKKIRDPRVFLSECLIKHPEWDEMEEPTW